MLLNDKILEDPLKEKTLPLFAQKLNINHYSPTQFSIPDAAWLFNYVYLHNIKYSSSLNLLTKIFRI